jgi:hypothetical protein
MSIVRQTPAISPSTIEKSLAFNEAHTSERLNHKLQRVLGVNGVLSGFRLEQTGDGQIKLYPGSFMVDGVVVTLKVPLTLDYSDLLVNGDLPRDDNDRKMSIVLWANNPDSSNFTAVQFGFATDADEESVTGDAFVHLAVLQPDDQDSEDEEAGRWSRVFGLSNVELARDVREGVQTIEAVAFASDAGALRISPDFATRPYFTHGHHLLVFADRFLLPPQRMLDDLTFPHFSRRSVIGIDEHAVDPTSFDFNGGYPDPYNLTTTSWGFVVSRDIEWQQVIQIGEPPAFLTLDQAVDPNDPKILVFENGLYVPMSEVMVDITGLQVTLTGGFVGVIYHIVKLSDFVFEVSVPLPDPTGDVPQDVDIEIPAHLFDAVRHSLMVFTRVAAGTNVADGGYIQINRSGTAARDGAGVVVDEGFTVIDAGKIRLRNMTVGAGVTGSIVILCLRGSTKQNFLSKDTAKLVPFYKRWIAVTGQDVLADDEIQAFPDLQAFVVAAPGAAQEVRVALHGVDSDFLTPDGTKIKAGIFNRYRFEQLPGLESETSFYKAPREVTDSAAPAYGPVVGFQEQWATAVLTVPTTAQAALAGDPVRLRGGHLIEELPVYDTTANKLRVAIDGQRLVPGIDFEKVSNTTLALLHELLVGQYLEVWVD